MKLPSMDRKRWVALLSAIGIIVAAAITTAAVTGGGDKNDDSPLLATATTIKPTSTTHKATTTTTVKLPQPEPPPADPYANVPIVQVGVIEIPKIGLVHPIFEGVTLTVIDQPPSSLSYTPNPATLTMGQSSTINAPTNTQSRATRAGTPAARGSAHSERRALVITPPA